MSSDTIINSIKNTLFDVFDGVRVCAITFEPSLLGGGQLGYRVVQYLSTYQGSIVQPSAVETTHVYINSDEINAVTIALAELFGLDLQTLAQTRQRVTLDSSINYHDELERLFIRYKLEDPASPLAPLACSTHYPLPMSEAHTVMFMTQAYAQANRSYAKDLKVGAVLVEALPNNLHRIISDGYNGTEPKAPNNCEDDQGESLPDVIHAERNLFRKLMRSHESGVGSILFVTRSPCINCVERIIDADVAHVVYCEEHSNPAPMLRLMEFGVKFSKVPKELIISNVESIAQRLKQPKFNECHDCGN